MRLELPENFIKTISSAYGKRGENWLTEIPKILKKCEDLWENKLPLTTNNYMKGINMKKIIFLLLRITFYHLVFINCKAENNRIKIPTFENKYLDSFYLDSTYLDSLKRDRIKRQKQLEENLRKERSKGIEISE